VTAKYTIQVGTGNYAQQCRKEHAECHKKRHFTINPHTRGSGQLTLRFELLIVIDNRKPKESAVSWVVGMQEQIEIGEGLQTRP